MTKGKKAYVIVLCVLLVLVLAFIWGNSMIGQDSSAAESSVIYDKVVEPTVKPVVEPIEQKYNIVLLDRALFRKYAHWTEFCVLGVIVGLLLFATKKYKFVHVFAVFAFGLAVAVMDETIQIFSARGPSIKDVWIDFWGYATASVVFLIIYSVKFVKAKKQQKKAEDGAVLAGDTLCETQTEISETAEVKTEKETVKESVGE